MKFGKTKGTEGLLKLTNFGVAALIFVDIQPTTVSWEASVFRLLLKILWCKRNTPGRWCIGF